MNNIGPLGAAAAGNPVNLPPAPQTGTTIQPLMSADEIFPAELAVINETRPGQELYIDQYTLPGPQEANSTGTPASNAQRQILGAIASQIKFNNVKVYVIANNSPGQNGAPPDNQASIDYLRQCGAYILPYPTQYVDLNHTKLVANNDYAVITSANESPHMSDAPDDNTGFLFAGAAAHNGIVHSFLPQWNFAAQQDKNNWAVNYPAPGINPQMIPDDKVTWLNTAPAAESGSKTDTTEIGQAYQKLILKAAAGPANAYLYLEHWDVTNLALINSLIDAKKQNPSLDIRMIADPNQCLNPAGTTQQNTDLFELKEIQQLKAAGIQVKFACVNPKPGVAGDDRPQIFHDKWIDYNGQEVINGSANFSESAMNENEPNSKFKRNREVDVDVADQASAQTYTQKFLNDWANNSAEDPQIAAKGNPNPPAPNPTPNPGPDNPPNTGTDQGWQGYLNRLATYTHAIESLFNLPPSSPTTIFPSANPGLNWGLGTVSYMNPLTNLLAPQVNLTSAGPMPWVIPGDQLLGALKHDSLTDPAAPSFRFQRD